jgi:hypothetical protein
LAVTPGNRLNSQVLRRIVSGAYGGTIMTSKTLTWDLVAAALLMMAGGRANTQASPAHDPLAIWVSNNAFIKTCVDNARKSAFFH